MRYRKNTGFLTLVLSIFFFHLLTGVAHAQTVGFKIPNPTKYESLEDIISAAGSLIQVVFILTFGAMIIYAGWIRLTSKGNADKVQESTQIIVAASVGFAIAVLAPTVVKFVTGALGVTGLESI